MSKSLVLLLIGAMGCLLSPGAGAQELTIESLRESLKSNNPLLGAAMNQVQSAQSTARSKGRKPDPFLKMGLFPKAVETRNGAMKSKLGISQVFPPGSRLHFEKQLFLDAVSVEELKKQKLFQDLVLKLETKFLAYQFQFKKKEVLQENLKILEAWIKLWESHYSHHNFAYQRLVQFQVDAREIEDQIREVDERIPVLFQELMQLSWQSKNEIELPQFNGIITSKIPEFTISGNPQILILEAELKKQKSRLELSKSFYKPKYMLGTEWTQIDSNRTGPGQGDDAFMVTLGVDLVLDRSRVRHRVQGDEFKFKAIEERMRYKQRSLEIEYQDASFRKTNARKEFLLIRDDLLPRTREALDSIQASYTTKSKGMDYFSLLGHLKKLLKLSLAMEKHYKNYFQADAKLRHISGTI